MGILNYTTGVSVEKTIGEIQKTLAEAGAKKIMLDYGNEGIVEAIAFQISVKGQPISFLLPANLDAIYEILQSEQPRYRSREQAARVAWRIVKSWVEAQLALVAAEQGYMAQVFLPYAQTSSGETIWERVESGEMLPMLTHDG